MDRCVKHLVPMVTQVNAVMFSLDLVDSSCSPEAITEALFLVLLPIQGHAFLLTLLRKNIIASQVLKGLAYVVMLVPGNLVILIHGGRTLVLCTVLYIIARLCLPTALPKYVLYVVFVLIVNWRRRVVMKAKDA